MCYDDIEYSVIFEYNSYCDTLFSHNTYMYFDSGALQCIDVYWYVVPP